ncbi:vitamin D3 hydroxylase-associated protein-like isoform X2 [Simochromis diagramma]|uniref:vitamin D3 hydroxylase-associated protein-like isoform X2 n=1 Tax=Simochromis diagramma TaxID=43689 RepID=UPI001A7EA9C8|nr:vitamin D3 hydroxylase-associated protein-like isoform X2 [Simochromis diagramma]
MIYSPRTKTKITQNTELFIKRVKMDNWTAALLTGVACIVGYLAVRVKKINSLRQAEEKIKRARNRRDESLQRAEQAVLRYKQSHPTTDSAFILTLSLSELTQQLKEGSLTPEDVLYSYMEKTLAVNQKLNCCTEILLESLDQLTTVGSNKDGLLYGVPVSIKENLAFKNHDCSCGVIINLDQPAEKDSVLVQVLKKQGAIPFVKTNLPQGLLSCDCSNPIYGQTVNPHNPQKTSGGSTGGEGALIGGGGSLLGIGTDLGGSIRIPASFCGICGFKPTAGRLRWVSFSQFPRNLLYIAEKNFYLTFCVMISSQGVCPTYRGQKSVLSSPGPMARDVDSLALCMQALLCDHMFSLDPTVPPLPFNMERYRTTKPLRIGCLENDGYMHPSPSMARGVREVKALLEQAGHTVVPYHPLKMDEIFPELMVKGFLADGGTSLLTKLKGGPEDPCLKGQFHRYRLPKWYKTIHSFLLKSKSPRVSANMRALCGVRSVPELWKQHAAVEDYIQETIAHWRSCNIDVLLCPVIGPAYNLFYCSKIPTAISYTVVYNLLNFPAGVVTVSTVTAKDEEELKHYKGCYQDMWDKLFKEHMLGIPHPEGVQKAS